MKKIISLILILSMSCSFGVFASEEYTMLNTAGVLSSAYSSYGDGDTVTRGVFAKAVAELMNLGDALVDFTERYSDVTEETQNNKEIMTLSEMKILSGYSDGSFRPEKEVLYSEAIKVLVNILGYDFKAIAYGGYPTGYLMTANEIGLLSGAGGAYSDPISFKSLMRLFDNAIGIPVTEITGVDSDGNYTYTASYSNTLGYKYHKVIKAKGIVTATPYAALAGYYKAADDKINIDGVSFELSDYGLYENIGMQLDYIYSVDELTGAKTLLYAKPTENNDITEIDISDYTNYAGNTIYYTTPDGKSNTLVLDPLADVIVNGENGAISKALLDSVVFGTITVVSSASSEVVIVKSYYDMIVGKVDEYNKKLHSEDGQKIIDFSSGTKEVKIFDSKGSAVNFNFIASGDILTIMDSTNYCEIYVSAEAVTGILYTVFDENDGTYVTLGDKTVKLTPDAANTISNYSAGSNIRIDLNKFGMGARIKLLSREGYEFAYFLQMGETNPGTPAAGVVVKFYSKERGLLTLSLDSDININSVLYKEATYAQVSSALNGDIERLMGIKISEEENIITHILTPGELADMVASGEDGFVRTHPLASRHRYKDPTRFNAAINVTASTPVMVIPTPITAAGDDGFYMTTISSLPEGALMVEAYNSTVDYGIPDYIVYRPAAGSGSAPSLTTASPFVVIKSITTAVTPDGATATKFTVQNGSAEKVFYYDGTPVADTIAATTTAYTVDDLGVGDMIRYSVDSRNYIGRLEAYYDYDKDLWMYNDSNIQRASGYIKTTVSRVTDSYLYVPAWKGNEMDVYSTMDLNEKTLSIGGITILTKRAGKDPIITGGTSADVKKYDDIVIHAYAGQLLGIVLIK